MDGYGKKITIIITDAFQNSRPPNSDSEFGGFLMAAKFLDEITASLFSRMRQRRMLKTKPHARAKSRRGRLQESDPHRRGLKHDYEKRELSRLECQ